MALWKAGIRQLFKEKMEFMREMSWLIRGKKYHYLIMKTI